VAFELKSTESVSEGIARNVRREIEKALGQLGARSTPRQRPARETLAVHEVRKCFKRVRAALRLVRGELGDETYREENYSFRDAGRPLTEVRDAQMLVETLDKLREELGDALGPGAIEKVRAALLAHQEDVTRRVLREDKAFAFVEKSTRLALARLADWRIDHDGWAALEDGLGHVYGKGRHAFALAVRDPSVEKLHEWRKQAKYLWHELQLLEPAWSPHDEDLGRRAHELSRLLGDDHDLAVLRETLAADPLAYGGHVFLKGLFAHIDRRRQELERQAFELGRQLYGAAAKAFTSRVESYWNAWARRQARERPMAAATVTDRAKQPSKSRPSVSRRPTLPLGSTR
jgi:CHAD domain-containing protein